MSHSDILKDVVAELKTEPGLRDDDIAVGVRDGPKWSHLTVDPSVYTSA